MSFEQITFWIVLCSSCPKAAQLSHFCWKNQYICTFSGTRITEIGKLSWNKKPRTRQDSNPQTVATTATGLQNKNRTIKNVASVWDIFDCPTVVLKHLKLFKPYKKLSSQVILREQAYSKKQVWNSKLRVAILMSNKPNSIRMKYLNVWTSCQEWDSLLGQGSASVVDQESRLSQG